MQHFYLDTDWGRRVVALHIPATILQKKTRRRRTQRCRCYRRHRAHWASRPPRPCQSKSSSGHKQAATQTTESLTLECHCGSHIPLDFLLESHMDPSFSTRTLNSTFTIVIIVHFVHQKCINLWVLQIKLAKSNILVYKGLDLNRFTVVQTCVGINIEIVSISEEHCIIESFLQTIVIKYLYYMICVWLNESYM